MTPMERLANWLGTRKDTPRPCGYGRDHQIFHEQPCTALITLRQSEADGHRGFCSSEHAFEDQAAQLL